MGLELVGDSGDLEGKLCADECEQTESGEQPGLNEESEADEGKGRQNAEEQLDISVSGEEDLVQESSAVEGKEGQQVEGVYNQEHYHHLFVKSGFGYEVYDGKDNAEEDAWQGAEEGDDGLFVGGDIVALAGDGGAEEGYEEHLDVFVSEEAHADEVSGLVYE